MYAFGFEHQHVALGTALSLGKEACEIGTHPCFGGQDANPSLETQGRVIELPQRLGVRMVDKLKDLFENTSHNHPRLIRSAIHGTLPRSIPQGIEAEWRKPAFRGVPFTRARSADRRMRPHVTWHQMQHPKFHDTLLSETRPNAFANPRYAQHTTQGFPCADLGQTPSNRDCAETCSGFHP